MCSAGAELANELGKIAAGIQRRCVPVPPLSSAADDPPASYPGMELLATAVLLLDETLEVRYANPAAENLFEVSRRQLLGNSARALFGDAPALFQAVDKALANGADRKSTRLNSSHRCIS